MKNLFFTALMIAGISSTIPLWASTEEEVVLISHEDEKPLLQQTVSAEQFAMMMGKLKEMKCEEQSCLSSLHQCALEAHMPVHLVSHSEVGVQSLSNCLCAFAGGVVFVMAGLMMQQAIDADIPRVIAFKWVSTVVLGLTAIILQLGSMKEMFAPAARPQIRDALEVFVEKVNAQREDGQRSISVARNEGNFVISIYSSRLVSAIKELFEKMGEDVSRLSTIMPEEVE